MRALIMPVPVCRRPESCTNGQFCRGVGDCAPPMVHPHRPRQGVLDCALSAVLRARGDCRPSVASLESFDHRESVPATAL